MNERILKLADKAAEGISGDLNIPDEFCEKFAELIIRECADIATMNGHQWESAGSYVLKHFGVE